MSGEHRARGVARTCRVARARVCARNPTCGNDCGSCEGNETTEETLIALGLAKDGENELEMQDCWLATTPVRSTDTKENSNG